MTAVREHALDEVKSLCAEYGNDSQPDSEYRLACNDLIEAIRALSAEPAQSVRPLEEWHEDHGNAVWWAWDNDRKEWLGEPAYIGKPLDSDWPDYHTHWTPHPAFPAAPTSKGGE